MKRNNFSFAKSLLLAVVAAMVIAGCTKLDENTYTDIQYDQFYNNRRDVMEAVLRPYTHMQAWLAPTGANGYYYNSEMAADQIAWPQKGRNGYDNGDHIRLHYHTWTADESRMREAWQLMWTGIGFCNSAIIDISKLDTATVGMTSEELTGVISELKVLRAFSYMKVMDMWGNVPISEKVPVGSDIIVSPTKPRDSVFAYIESELLENIPKLPVTTNEFIGRISQAGGYAMLAELYLNADVWTGKPMWDKCIAACDKIMSGKAGGINGGPALAPDIDEAFSNTNWKSKEPLLEIAYSKKGGFTFDFQGFFTGYDYMEAAQQTDFSGWNAMVTIPSAFDAFDDADLRKKDWFLFGPQYKFGTKTPILGSEEYAGKPIVFVNNIRKNSKGQTGEGSMIDGEENSGARFDKYKPGVLGAANYRETHYLIYRLTEIYFDKAEALMRKNGGKATQEAVDLINDCRERAFDPDVWDSKKYTTASMTLDTLLAERGREFIFEGKRREDLIRFGKFTTTSWWDHKPDGDKNKTLFPIPNTQLGANPELVQNPGY